MTRLKCCKKPSARQRPTKSSLHMLSGYSSAFGPHAESVSNPQGIEANSRGTIVTNLFLLNIFSFGFVLLSDIFCRFAQETFFVSISILQLICMI